MYGGSLIASRFVLSAQHCFQAHEQYNLTQAEPSDVRIMLGQHDRTLAGESEIWFKRVAVEKIIRHPNGTFTENNITILFLAEEVDISIYTTVCLPEMGAKFVGQDAIATAYGEQ